MAESDSSPKGVSSTLTLIEFPNLAKEVYSRVTLIFAPRIDVIRTTPSEIHRSDQLTSKGARSEVIPKFIRRYSAALISTRPDSGEECP